MPTNRGPDTRTVRYLLNFGRSLQLKLRACGALLLIR